MSNKRRRAISKVIDRRTKDKIQRIRAAKKIAKEKDAKLTPVKDAATAFIAGAGTAAALGKASETYREKQKKNKVNKRSGGKVYKYKHQNIPVNIFLEIN